MNKAKNLAKEYMEFSESEKPERTDLHMDGLKPAINNLLHMYLPEDITIKECETLSLVINEMIWNPYEFVRKEQ